MRTFTDNAGRTWSVSLNVDALKRVRSLCDVDLMNVVQDNGTLLARLADDPVLLCDVLYAVCREEAQAQGVTDVEFGRAMGGDAIAGAADALLQELVGFFPSPKRGVLARVLEKMRKYQDKAARTATERLDDPQFDARMERAIETALQGTAGGSSGAAPASSA